jgi:hypothetical protein
MAVTLTPYGNSASVLIGSNGREVLCMLRTSREAGCLCSHGHSQSVSRQATTVRFPHVSAARCC